VRITQNHNSTITRIFWKKKKLIKPWSLQNTI